VLIECSNFVGGGRIALISFLMKTFTMKRIDEADQLSTLGGLQAHYNTMAHCDEFVKEVYVGISLLLQVVTKI
jgi:hypothetical protein